MTMHFKRCIELAEHYNAIGYTEIYLDRDAEKPWSLVTAVEPGNSYRMSVPVSLVFKAKHLSGLCFRWFIDLEPDEASGSGYYRFDIARLRATLRKLPAPARRHALIVLRDKILGAVVKHSSAVEKNLKAQRRIEAGLRELTEAVS